jgi:allantoinase
MADVPFTFSALPGRPPLELPGGARVAVYLLMSIEYFVPGRPAVSLVPMTATNDVDPLNHGWRDYGPRVGVWRLVSLLDKYEMPVSCAVNSDACIEYPEIVEAGRERGWTWVAHGKNNSTLWTGMPEETERELLREVVETIASATGSAPRGWVGPALTETPNTYRLAAELGIDYTLNWANDDQPYLLATDRPIVAIPHPSEMHDIQQLYVQQQTAETLVDGMIETIDVLAGDGPPGAVFGVGIHPFLLGQPHRIRAFERFLASLRERADVWIASTDEIADWYLEARGGSPQ